MSLISILIALTVETLYKPISRLRRFDWFLRYSDWFSAKLNDTPLHQGFLVVIVVIGSVLFVVWLMGAMLAGVLGLFGFIFSLLVLIFCLGPRDLEEDVQHFLAAIERNDNEAAYLRAADMLDKEVDNSIEETVQSVKQGILVMINVRILGVLFWFLILGPIGAAMFRLSCLLKQKFEGVDHAYASSARDLYRILMWLPARLSVISFALVGNFVDTMSRWNGAADIWERDSEEFIIASGLGAVQKEQREDAAESDADPSGIRHVLSLVKRATIVWVAGLALLTMTGWVF